MEAAINLGLKEWNDFNYYLEQSFADQSKTNWMAILSRVLLWFLIAFIFLITFQLRLTPQLVPVAVVAGLAAASYLLQSIRVQKIIALFTPSATGTFCGPVKFYFGQQKLEIVGEGHGGHINWTSVKKIEKDENLIMIFIDTAMAYVLPVEQLHDPEALYLYALERWQEANTQK